MKVRGTIAGTPLSARLTALCWGALTLLALGGRLGVHLRPSSTAPPTVFSPSVTTGTASVATSASSAITSLVRQHLGVPATPRPLRHPRRRPRPR